MHDVLAHSLSALAVQLEGARLLARERGADAEVVHTIERSNRLARAGLDEARRAIEALRGGDMPGPDRLGELAAAFSEQTGVDCRRGAGRASRASCRRTRASRSTARRRRR